jgi:ATP-binding cassette subfamily C protein
LARLNRSAVRRQIGVVVQDSVLQPGTVLDNIIGMAGDLTLDDAWRAANLASIDGDIAAMPMQMFTSVGSQAGNFSGGEAQRIKIAAALARNPRIVFLDEATNSLDTGNQAAVMQSIEKLAATRIVIAHRLSTIRFADRIYVLQAGRVVQEGNFQQLMEEEGVFKDLTERQLA